ncbi:prolipoprotein diacylglyceryl transferase [Sphingomonas sp. LB-2]|uniref:prolipoprotein diacylglyceryl transferase n=1 Tax=Sphingomonas caeni TaxID=2984949 RepID=UPI0022317157|nr:prolipoprotein diacylglyceryl transferase family protein [Sphingomonas caeni]MCW3849024.1 prolipoprotein diacylglyceryl transferase [Sphingomonas caeni]
MIAIPTSLWLHYAGDAAAWLLAFLGARWVYRHRRQSVSTLAAQTEPGYFLALAAGGVLGAWLAGSLNSLRFAFPTPSHSIAGALAGAIVAVEIWKWRVGLRQSTGGPFVIPLTIGIVAGRWGCLFAGLGDGTYGTPTSLPWAVDLGDHIGRHPVQLYESLTMAVFLAVYWRALIGERGWAVRHGFHAFVLVYAVQRFVWEFLKPYPSLLGPLNLFHLLMIGLAAYALAWIARDARRPVTG